MRYRAKLIKVGNSSGVIVPSFVLKQMRLNGDEELYIELQEVKE